MAQKTLLLTEAQLNEFVTNVVRKMINETNEYMEGVATLQDIADAFAAELNGSVEPGQNSGELWVGENNVEYTFDVEVDGYVEPGRSYGYLELPDDPHVVIKGEPYIDGITLRIDGEVVEDDGTIESTLNGLLKAKQIEVDCSDTELFPSKREYFTGS